MKQHHLDFKVWLKDSIKNPEFKDAYDRQEPEFAIIRAIIEARITSGLSQKELAGKMGTKQSVISRLESGNANPSIKFLQKIAVALDAHLVVKFT